jgi:hypothetical protein
VQTTRPIVVENGRSAQRPARADAGRTCDDRERLRAELATHSSACYEEYISEQFQTVNIINLMRNDVPARAGAGTRDRQPKLEEAEDQQV